jgi:hypothetical protein
MDDEILFLIGINDDGRRQSVSHVTNKNEWNYILATARANGWNPLGTILDYEFQYQLFASKCKDLDFDKHILLDQFVEGKCGRWKGGYLSPEYQIVTDEDARGLRVALQRASASIELILFLSHGAFRIAGVKSAPCSYSPPK